MRCHPQSCVYYLTNRYVEQRALSPGDLHSKFMELDPNSPCLQAAGYPLEHLHNGYSWGGAQSKPQCI